MTTIYKVWLSECGQYYAIRCTLADGGRGYDVLERDGDRVWLWTRYISTSWQDADVRYTHAEFPHVWAGWSNHGRWTRGMTRYIEAFSMDFMDIRQDVQIRPFGSCSGNINPYLASYSATFRKQRRVSRATWEALQMRIAEAIAEGHRQLYAATGQQELQSRCRIGVQWCASLRKVSTYDLRPSDCA